MALPWHGWGWLGSSSPMQSCSATRGAAWEWAGEARGLVDISAFILRSILVVQLPFQQPTLVSESQSMQEALLEVSVPV